MNKIISVRLSENHSFTNLNILITSLQNSPSNRFADSYRSVMQSNQIKSMKLEVNFEKFDHLITASRLRRSCSRCR